jgi:polyketide synthase 7
MGAYGRLLEDYEPLDLECPTLLVKASEPIGDMRAADQWQSSGESMVSQTLGDHFTMMEEHAALTADVVEQWIAARE